MYLHLMNHNESSIGVTRPSIVFTIFILCWIHGAISKLNSQFIPKLWSPISTKNHIFHLWWLNHKAMPRLNFLKCSRYVFLINSPTTVINQNCSKPNLKSMKCSGSWNEIMIFYWLIFIPFVSIVRFTHANICCNATHIDISASRLLDEFCQTSLAKLCIVKESRIWVNIRINSLVDYFLFWV